MIRTDGHLHTLASALVTLPRVLHKPEILKLWLLQPVPSRVLLATGLLAVLLCAGPVSRALVDLWYPQQNDAVTLGLMQLLDSPLLHEQEQARLTLYWRLLLTCWLLALGAVLVLLLLDLPRAVESGERRAAELLRRSVAVDTSDPDLSETLKTQAITLSLRDESINERIDKIQSAQGGARPPPPVPEAATAEVETGFVGNNRRYRIEKKLASGGAGIVYQAEDQVLGRRVALKKLLEDLAGDDAQAARFQAEAQALALMNHENILPVYDLLEQGGRFWLVMELLNGGTLAERIKRQRGLSVDESLGITRGIAAGLDYAHRRGFVHRDIKPANILFAEDGSFRITDFGIAKHRASGIHTSQGLVLGSPAYMSPEQASGGAVDARSDLYSLGISLFQMLTASLPFKGDARAVMMQQITQAPPPPSSRNPSIEPQLDRLVMSLLAKDPDDRIQTAAQLIATLDQLASAGRAAADDPAVNSPRAT